MKTCKACGQKYDGTSPDPCLETLPGVRYACCGHGEGQGYISFENGLAIYFNATHIIDWENIPENAHDENGFVKRSIAAKVDFEKNSP